MACVVLSYAYIITRNAQFIEFQKIGVSADTSTQTQYLTMDFTWCPALLSEL